MSYGLSKRITEEELLLYQCFEELQPFGNEKGMKILANSWEILTIETIVNCFRKSGISFTVQQAVINGGFY